MNDMKKLCLFDLDGTLIDPYEAMTKGMQFALVQNGIDMPDRDFLKCFIGPPVRDSLRDFLNISDPEKIEQIYSKYLDYFAEHGVYENTLYPGVVEMLAELKKAGLGLAIATSKRMLNAQAIAEYLKIDHYFDVIIGCETDGTRSRKSEVIEYVLEKIDPQRQCLAIMIGDRKYDIIGAKETGISSVGITWGYGSREELEKEQPTLVVDSMAELCDWLILGK